MLTDSPSFHSPPFTYLPSIILLFRGGNYFEHFMSIMIMIIFIIIIHAGRAKGQVAAENVLPRPAPLILPQNEAAGFLPAGWRVCRSEPLFSQTHFLGVWTYCGVSVMSSTKSPLPAPRHRETSRIWGRRSERGLIIKRPSFLRGSNYTGGFWSFACWEIWMGRPRWGLFHYFGAGRCFSGLRLNRRLKWIGN